MHRYYLSCSDYLRLLTVSVVGDHSDATQHYWHRRKKYGFWTVISCWGREVLKETDPSSIWLLSDLCWIDDRIWNSVSRRRVRDNFVVAVHGITAAVDIVVACLPGWTMCRQTTPFYHTIPSTHQGTITLSSGERHGSQSLFVDCCASRSLHFSYTLGGTGQLSTSCHRNRYPLSIYVDGQTAQRPWTDDTIARPKKAFPVVPRKRHEQIQKRIPILCCRREAQPEATGLKVKRCSLKFAELFICNTFI